MMKLGVYLHTSSPFKPRTTINEYISTASRLDQLGYESLWFADHLIRTPDPNESPLYETWSLIAALSRETENIQFGTMVTPVTFRNFGTFVKSLSTIDHLSNGRVIVGLGIGWFDKEHEMFGIDYPSISDRYILLEETLQALSKLWTEDYVSFNGDYINLDKAYLNPKPLDKPKILIGGGGEKKTLKLVAKYADMSNFGGDKDTISHKVNVLKTHCDNVGTSFDEISKTTNMAIVMGKDQGEVNDGIENYIARLKELGRRPPNREEFKNNRLVGTPSQVLDQIEEIAELGIDQINLTVNDDTSEKLLEDLIKLL